MKPWFERDPELLDREISALEELGAVVRIDNEARGVGILRLFISYPTSGGQIDLIGHYPDLFPFFRPEVFAPGMALQRHQHPISKGLCLIGRKTALWYASETLAGLLKQQFPRLIDLAAGGDVEDLIAHEEAQGEPFSDYYNSNAAPQSFLLIDSSWHLPREIERGEFTALCREVSQAEEPQLTVQGYISEVRAADGSILATYQGPQLPGMDKVFVGRWLRLGDPVLGGLDELIGSLTEEQRSWLTNERSWSKNRHLQLAALIIPEEVQHRQFADGWAPIQWLAARLQKGFDRRVARRFIKTSRAGLDDLAARMPAGRQLESKSALLIGAGAIGSPVAVELAKAGIGKLIVVDHDNVDPATIRRWVYGVSAFNHHKGAVLREKLEAEYPWTTIEPQPIRIGSIENEAYAPKQGEVLTGLIASADLVIDCSAELGINHVISEMCRAQRRPYLVANATPGAWGGMVAAFTEDKPCWLCLRHALYDTQTITLPPADPEGELQPPGCADPTFTGSAFDLEEVSLEVVRTAVGLLTNEDGYPAPDWQVATLALRAQDGRRIIPQWTAQELVARPDCGHCS